MRSAVGRFVERNLEGSVVPFLAYLSDAPRLTDAELRELKDVVSRLESTRSREKR